MSPPVFRSRGRQTDHSKSDSNYNSFYNIKKTRMSARYPFLPKKQIERKIKHLWERASAEKRATLCLTSSGTTAKSPFKGSILRGLCKKKVPVDQFIPNSGHLSNGTPANAGGTGPVHTLRSSIRSPHTQACEEQNLRSSARKHVSTRRVSFNFEQSSPSRPTTRSSILEHENKGNSEKIRSEKSKMAEVGSQGHLKKRNLSLDEEKVYEFEDEGSRSCNLSMSEAVGGRMTRLKPAVREHVFDPEEYNLESTLNSKTFNGNSQSHTIMPEQKIPKPPKRRCKGESAQKLANDKETGTGRNANGLKYPTVSQGKDQVKRRNKPKGPGKGRRDDMTSPQDDINTTQSDDTGEVPWIVSACRDSSSDEVQDDSGDDDDDDEKKAIYEYYHKSSSDSSTPTMPSLSQDSEESLCSPHENDTMFSWDGVCFTKKNASIATDAFESQLSLVSMDAAEVMSVSTEASLSLNSPPSEFGFPGKLMTSPRWSLSPPDNKKEPVAPQNRRMHLSDGATMETPRSTRRCGLDTDEPPMVITSPGSRKRKMRGQGGEDMVSVITTRNTREKSNQTPLSSKQPEASRGYFLVSSNGRNVLAETNSRPINAAPKTNKTKREKEDRVPAVKTKRSGRIKEGMKNGSQSAESSAAERGDDGLDLRGSRKAPQVTRSTEHHAHRDNNTERGSKLNGEDKIFQSDGILCDLFQPNISSQKRSFNPPSELEFYQGCMDPVASHLFLEENFFL